MKRSEIKVGDELYYARGQDWRCPRYAPEPDGTRALVVELPDYGQRVVVELRGSRIRVSPVLLRGPWAQVHGEVSAALADRADERAAERDERAAAVYRADVAVDRAKHLGFWAAVDLTGEPRITLDVQEFMRLLDRLDGAS